MNTIQESIMNNVFVEKWNSFSRDKKKALAFELDFAMRGADNFNSMLIRLVFKADKNNREILFVAYPDYVAAVHVYQNDEFVVKEFFDNKV